MKIVVLLGMALLPVYFFLFFRAFQALSAEDRQRYAKTGSPMLRSLVCAGVIAAFLFASDDFTRVAIANAAFAYTIGGSLLHHRRLAQARFPDPFVRRIVRSSYVAFLALGLIVAGFTLQVFRNASSD